MLSTQSAVLGMAVNLQRDLSHRAEIRDFYARRMVDIGDEKQRMSDAENRGISQGIIQGVAIGETKGEAKSRRETARKMLERGFDAAVISEITGLSEAEIKE